MPKRSKGNNIALNRTNNLLKKYKSILSQYYCYHLLAVKVPPFVSPINVDQFQFPFKLSLERIPSKKNIIIRRYHGIQIDIIINIVRNKTIQTPGTKLFQW